MNPRELVAVGQTDLHVSRLGFGGGTLGDPSEVTCDHQAELTLEAAYAAGIAHFDTSPWYGNGKSEHRVGRTLRNKPRDSFVLTTKVGRVYKRPADPKSFRQERWLGGFQFDLDFDYTRDGVMRSYEQSLMRLGMTEVDALLIHDLDPRHQKTVEEAMRRLDELSNEGGYQALADMRATGEIKAIGAGVNHVGMIPHFLERFEVDFFLVASPFNLMDQEAGILEELDNVHARGASVVIGAPFASGILATGARSGALYRYQAAGADMLDKVQRIAAVCARYDVPLGSAALQYPFAHPAIASIIPGPNSPMQFKEIFSWMDRRIPAELWQELKRDGLISENAPTPG